MSNRRNYQAGSLVGFAVVGVLLAIVLVGGLYWLQNYRNGLEQTGQEVANNSEKATDKAKDKAKEKTTTSKDNDKKSSSTDKSTVADDTPKADKNTPASNDNKELPQTGPADTAFQLIGISILTFATTAYIRSRYAL